jgi:outer membrane lipoprotein-sorting protein
MDSVFMMIHPLTRFAWVLAAFTTVLSLPAFSQTGTRQTINQTIAALGGDAFMNVKEIQTTGRFFSFRRGELTGGDLFVDYIKFPDMERAEFGREKNKSITVNKGSEGWAFEPKEKEWEPQPVSQAEEFLKGFRTSFDYVLRFVLSHPQTTIQSLGSEIIDFKRADVVEIRDAQKNRIRFSIDRETRLPLKMQVRRSDESGLREEIYANWHEFQGVKTPLLLIRSTDGVKMMEIRLETAAYNSGLSDSLFMPSATASK